MSVFKEAAKKSKRELVIKNEGAPNKSPEAAAVEKDEYELLYEIPTLNHLVIAGFSNFSSVSCKISQLQQLFQLVLTGNTLTELPPEIGSLCKLKHLDVSGNKLARLPAQLYSLATLQTVILSHNCLTDESFPPGVHPGALPNLHHVDVVNNQLTKLPEMVYRASNLQELIALDNSISVIENSVGGLGALKQVDLKRNCISGLPYELSLCSKLKSLDLVDNPISDRRLLKIVTQHGPTKPKTILDYVSTHSPRPEAEKKGKSKKKSAGAVATDTDDAVVFSDTRPVVRIVRPTEYAELVATPEARGVRPYVVCAIVRDVDLASGNNYRKFINLQTKLHDGVCKRRRAATIATHDLSKISLPLSYTAGPAEGMRITPLGRPTPLSVQEYLYELEAAKLDKRGGGGKKGAKKPAAEPDPVTAALSKYLQFVDAAMMVAIRDSTGTLVSLPPLTNSDNTKIEASTSDLWLEVTSCTSLAIAKTVMDSLVCEISLAGLAAAGVLSVEQVKVVEGGARHLLVLYPSRTDLVDNPSILVERPD